MSGLLTLIPARRWPRAVREIYLWGPAVLLGGGLAAMSLASAPSATAAEEIEQRAERSAEQTPEERRASPLRRVVAGLVIGSVVGGTAHGIARLSLWADDAAERGLRGIGVRRPRPVMAVVGGIGVGAMAAAENRAESRGKTEDSGRSEASSETGAGAGSAAAPEADQPSSSAPS